MCQGSSCGCGLEWKWSEPEVGMCATTHVHFRTPRDSLIGDDIPLPEPRSFGPEISTFSWPHAQFTPEGILAARRSCMAFTRCTTISQSTRASWRRHHVVHELQETCSNLRKAPQFLIPSYLVEAQILPSISQWFSSSAVAERAWTAYCAGGRLMPTLVWVFALVRALLSIIV